MLFLLSVFSLVAGGVCSQVAARTQNYSSRLEQCGGALLVFGLLLLGVALNEAMRYSKSQPGACTERPAQCSEAQP